MPYHQFSIHLPQRDYRSLTELLMLRGCLGTINEPAALIAYFPHVIDPKDVTRELEIWKALMQNQARDYLFHYEYSAIPDTDWNASWKRRFQPIDIGSRFTIMPPWEVVDGNRIPLIIDPGMAFGTGHHETTRSCLLLMEQYAVVVRNDSFLDLGTGTGLLAIAAHKMGFRRVTGLDTDPLALEAARRNLELNNVEGILLSKGSLTAESGCFDMIAANLVSGTLVAIAGEIAACLDPYGVAILSGILHGQEKDVLAAAEDFGLRLERQIRDGKWMALAVKH